MQGISLKVEGLKDGAKSAIDDGMSFDEYCDLISKVIISGQTVEEIKKYLTALDIDKLFEDE